MSNATIKQTVDEFRQRTNGQVVLVLQGGGALGANQVGVYQALHEANVEPDWVIGTSIGAINAGLIAGNRFEDRLSRLDEFWKRVQRPSIWPLASAIPASSGFSTRGRLGRRSSTASPDSSSLTWRSGAQIFRRE